MTRTSGQIRYTPSIIGRNYADGIERSIEGERYALVFGLFEDVPWKEDSSAAFPEDIEILMDAVDIRLRETEGEAYEKIPFWDKRWKIHNVEYKFESFPADMEVKVKKYVLYNFISHEKPAYVTIQGHLDELRRYYKALFELFPYKTFGRIHTDNIINCVQKMKATSNTRASMLESVIEFYSFLITNYPDEKFDINMQQIQMKRKYYAGRASRNRGSNQRPSIPEELFLTIQMKCIEVARNPGAPYRDRVTACIILIFSWLGLRPNEIPWLKPDDLNRCIKEGMEFHTSWYRSPKNGMRLFEVYCFPLAFEAIKILIDIRRRSANINDNEYLIVYDGAQGKGRVEKKTIDLEYTNFLVTYLKEAVERDWPGMKKVTGHGLARGKKISRPCLYSYRVHQYNFLMEHNFDEYWVERNMGHLSAGMRGVYYRNKDNKGIEMCRQITMNIGEASSGHTVSDVTSLLESQLLELNK